MFGPASSANSSKFEGLFRRRASGRCEVRLRPGGGLSGTDPVPWPVVPACPGGDKVEDDITGANLRRGVIDAFSVGFRPAANGRNKGI